MGSYRLVWKSSAEKELRALPRDAIARMVALAEELPSNPFPRGARKLAGAERTYRLKSGNYRVIYSVNEATLGLEILRVGHRMDVYR